MSVISRAGMVVRSNLNSHSSQDEVAFSPSTIQERIAELKKSICELTLEYEHLKSVHREQTNEAERYYKQAQKAMKSDDENPAQTLLTQRRELMGLTGSLKSRLEQIERTLPSLKTALTKLDSMAELFLANPDEIESLQPALK